MSNQIKSFQNLEEVANHFRDTDKKFNLIYAHNGIGKTRLSMEFKNKGRSGDSRDTLYYNAFTEDLFSWDNDLESDTNRALRLNLESKFFSGLDELDIESRISPFLSRYADFDFYIDMTRHVEPFLHWKVGFSREVIEDEINRTIEDIKISRGEENIFIWCFFLAVVQLAIDEYESYQWVKYIYIDDPISSLDDNNVITVASHLSQLLKQSTGKKFIISTHHGLFYNVIFNELNANKYLLNKKNQDNIYLLKSLKKDTPFYQHLSVLKELDDVSKNRKIYKYHFNLLRNVLEKTAAFHGFYNFSKCIKEDNNIDINIHARRINTLSHGNYSIFDPEETNEIEKDDFKKVLQAFLNDYNFNPELFIEEIQEESQQ